MRAPLALEHPHATCSHNPLQLPADAKLSYFNADGNMQEVALGTLTKGKKVRGRPPDGWHGPRREARPLRA